MKKSISIAIACAIGAGIGTMLALSFGALWVFGLLIGSLVGYLIYDLPTVLAAIPEAWKYAQNSIQNFGAEKFRKRILVVSKMVYLFIVFVLLVVGVFFLFLEIPGRPPVLSVFLLLTLLISYSWCSIFLLHIVCIWDTYVMKKRKALRYLNNSKLTWAVFLAKRSMVYGFVLVLLSPVVGFICGVHLILDQLFLVFPKFLWKQIRFAGNFFWKFFKLIHSDIRLLVGIDSFIGACIGFYVGNPIIGMITGGILGFINYYFVSIKWLKLHPKH